MDLHIQHVFERPRLRDLARLVRRLEIAQFAAEDVNELLVQVSEEVGG